MDILCAAMKDSGNANCPQHVCRKMLGTSHGKMHKCDCGHSWPDTSRA